MLKCILWDNIVMGDYARAAPMMYSRDQLFRLLCQEWDTLKVKSREQILDIRRHMLRSFNGDEMPSIRLWPRNIRRLLFKQTALSDSESFQLTLFFLGNGFSPLRVGVWILTLYALIVNHDRERRGRKRCTQIAWIYSQIDNHRQVWRYFDLGDRKILHFDGRIYRN